MRETPLGITLLSGPGILCRRRTLGPMNPVCCAGRPPARGGAARSRALAITATEMSADSLTAGQGRPKGDGPTLWYGQRAISRGGPRVKAEVPENGSVCRAGLWEAITRRNGQAASLSRRLQNGPV